MPKKKCFAIYIDESLCKGCDICVELCGKDVFTVSGQINQKGYYIPIPVNIDDCSGCRICELICPEIAVILIDKSKVKQSTKKQPQKV
ncbi:ferredoxin family protein [candidate division KSB1 bacterium]